MVDIVEFFRRLFAANFVVGFCLVDWGMDCAKGANSRSYTVSAKYSWLSFPDVAHGHSDVLHAFCIAGMRIVLGRGQKSSDRFWANWVR